jgi:hypothetical protein
MKTEITQQDIDNLADIIWFIRGYNTAQKVNGTESYADLCENHVQSLKKFRNALSDFNNFYESQKPATSIPIA